MLGSVGQGRKQLQIINQIDTVAAHGIKYQTYESIVQDRVQSLGGGEFTVVLDSANPEHTISDTSLNVILKDLLRSLE